MARKWTEEEKAAQSERMKELWKRPSTRRKVSEARRIRRENGECIVNIEQMASHDAYKAYQREYKRIYYSDPDKYAAWKAYTNMQKLKRRSMDELVALREKHRSKGREDLVEKVERAMWMKIDELIRKTKAEAERVDAQIHSDT